MLKFVGIFGAGVLQRNFGSLPCQNRNIDSAYASNVGLSKGNAEWWCLLALSKLNTSKLIARVLNRVTAFL